MKRTTNYRQITKWQLLMLVVVVFSVEVLFAQVKEFEIVSRKPVPTGGTEFMGLTRNNTPAYYQIKNDNGRTVYKISGTSANVTIDALSYVEHAREADRIVTYGDSLHKHVVTKAYVRFYSGSGTLIKSLDAVAYWPFTATLAENGDFIIAGNKDKQGGNPQMFIACFDKDGNKVWESNLPNMFPQRVYSAPDRKYIALVMFQTESLQTNISLYSSQGTMLYKKWTTTVSGVEFLPSDKVVIVEGNRWNLYNIIGNFAEQASGALQGNTIGQYPITAHPGRNLFFIVSIANQSGTGFRLQTFDSNTGTLVMESVFAGTPYWQSYRLADVTADDRVNLKTTSEMIELRIK